jgi:hypothetical protein
VAEAELGLESIKSAVLGKFAGRSARARESGSLLFGESISQNTRLMFPSGESIHGSFLLPESCAQRPRKYEE